MVLYVTSSVGVKPLVKSRREAGFRSRLVSSPLQNRDAITRLRPGSDGTVGWAGAVMRGSARKYALALESTYRYSIWQ